MKIQSVSLKNFASYESLEFDFTNQGLCLIQGPTGAGKSTLMDAIPWLLFGITSKGGKVDDVRSWNTKGSTEGTIRLDSGITITRTRNPNTRTRNSNDLSFCAEYSILVRGSDLNNTQRIINEKLGITSEQYLAGCYYHEFSQTAQFFTTNAKIRRTICEQIVDLTLASKLQITLKQQEKSITQEKHTIVCELETLSANLNILQKLQRQEHTKALDWRTTQDLLIANIQTRIDTWESDKTNRVKQLTHKHTTFKSETDCPTCGNKMSVKRINPYTEQLEREASRQNPYIEELKRNKLAKNPYTGAVKDFTSEIENNKTKVADLEATKLQLGVKLADIETLLEVTAAFRASLISNTIQTIEQTTNDLLTKHFDAEIRVSFQVEDNDKLEVGITKDGNECSFTQLSKGQRQILKLCFGVAIMKQVNQGLGFSQVFFDEALDGLDESMKAKAIGLLEALSLEYESVFVVEHSEGVKAMINNQYKVELVNGKSQIQKV